MVGLEHLVCPTLGAYIDAAAALARPEARVAAKRLLEPNLHRLADDSAVSALERHIIESTREAGAAAKP